MKKKCALFILYIRNNKNDTELTQKKCFCCFLLGRTPVRIFTHDVRSTATRGGGGFHVGSCFCLGVFRSSIRR